MHATCETLKKTKKNFMKNYINEHMQFLWHMKEINYFPNKWTPELQLCETHLIENVKAKSMFNSILKNISRFWDIMQHSTKNI